MMLSLRWVVDFVTLVLCLVSTLGVRNPPQEHPTFENITSMVNKRLRLYCRLGPQDNSTSRGDVTAVTWYHNDNKMNPGSKSSQKSFTLKDNALIFKSLLVSDRGKYHCEDSRGVKQNEIQLTIHVPVTIVKEQLPAVRNYSYQPNKTEWFINCPAAGIPLPTIQWRKNGEIMTDIKPVKSNEAFILSTLMVPLSEPAQYNCTAMNRPGKEGPQYASVVYNVLGPVQVKGNTGKRSGPVCAPYNGTVCSEFLQGRMVLHNTTTDYSAEATLDTFSLDDSPVGTAEDFCQKPALRLLCHQTYPECDDRTVEPVPICQESCLAVVTLFCFRELAEGKAKSLPSAEDCYSLPSKWDLNKTCTDSDHHEFSPAKVRDDCYFGKGRWYNGTVNVTRSGRACQRWIDKSPQKHDRSPLYFPELQASENYCRNPGGEERQPWCYTTDKLVRWEFCDVNSCELSGLPGDDSNRRDEMDDDKEELIIILVPVLFCCLLIPLIGLLVKWKRSQYNSTSQDDVDIDVENLPINSAYHQMKSNRLNPKLETLEFPRNDIVFIEDIGQGAFGRVFKARIVCSNGNSHITGGKLSGSKHSLSCGKNCKHNRNPFTSKGDLHHIDIHSNLKNIDVKLLGEHLLCDHEKEETTAKYSEGQLIAIKMLKEDASDTVQADFEREASLMVEFDHPNIVRLLGVCTIGKPMCLLFEYMNKGDLNEFLRLCSPDQCLRRSDAGSVPSLDDVSSIDIVDQLHMARQICNGMVYLSERGYVHRDLATRNCLVSNSLTVKISDFGLARSVHSMDYYHGSDKDAIPIRWMPPEAILYNKFSSQSDVWSFGVLLWEIFSFALQPYYGMTHEQVINYLRAGHILEQTENVTSVVYDLMKSCWHKKPTSRPSFISLYKSLTMLYEEHSKQKARCAFSL